MSCAPSSLPVTAVVAALKPPSLPVLTTSRGGDEGGHGGGPSLLARSSPRSFDDAGSVVVPAIDLLSSPSSPPPPPAPSLLATNPSLSSSSPPLVLAGPLEATLASNQDQQAGLDASSSKMMMNLANETLPSAPPSHGDVRGATTTTATITTKTTAAASTQTTTTTRSSCEEEEEEEEEEDGTGFVAAVAEDEDDDYAAAVVAVVSASSSPRSSSFHAGGLTPAAAPPLRSSSSHGKSSTTSSSYSLAAAAAATANSHNSEKVGRWTESEHNVFLEGLKVHGKQWKTIAGMIGTRTVVQVRTHAQKYFQKLDRKQQQGGGGSSSSSSNNVNSGAASTSSNSSTSSSSLASSPTPPTTLTSSSVTVTAQQPKRRSLPPSLPSRKKAKLATGHAKAKPRISISLVGERGATASKLLAPPTGLGSSRAAVTTTGTTNSVALCHSPSSDVMLSLPAFSASATSVSLENLSTISPSGVTDFDDLDDTFLFYAGSSSMLHPKIMTTTTMDVEPSSTSFLGVVDSFPSDPHAGMGIHTASSSSVAAVTVDESTAASSYIPMGEDPLEWLLENDSSIQHLPESSLTAPMFPDFSELSSSSSTGGGAAMGASAAPAILSSSTEVSYKSAGFAPLQLPALRIGVTNNPVASGVAVPAASSAVITPAAGDVTDHLPYADPKVTVQALFLVDDNEFGKNDDGDHEPNDIKGDGCAVDDGDDIDVDMEEASALLLP